MKPWLLYSVIRVVLFFGVLAVLLSLGMLGWLAAIIAAIVGLCVSYLFFGKLRGQVAQGLADRRSGATVAPRLDEDAEDAIAPRTRLNDGPTDLA